MWNAGVLSRSRQLASALAKAGIGKGDAVEFEMRGEPDKDGDYVIERLKKKAAK